MATDYADWGTPAAIAAQISALGLATASLQATAAQISAALVSSGVPPYVKSITNKSGTALASGGLSQTLYTWTQAGRIWAVSWSYCFSASGSFTGQSSQFARVQRTNENLLVGQLRLRAADQSLAISGTMSVPGFPVGNGDTFDVLFDGNPTNTEGDVAATVFYSVP